jgi:hypothetical protein
MRPMEISPFPQRASFVDLENLYRTRLKLKLDAWSHVSTPLLGYMAWPNEPDRRKEGLEVLRSWMDGEDKSPDLPLVHKHWSHIADIVNVHYALTNGEHQKSRGGASIGKAIFLASKLIKNRGAKQASLWENWHAYKDVAHLIAATIAVCFDMQTRNRQKPLGLKGFQDLLPARVVCLVPDLILGVAMTYEKYGLNGIAKGSTEPMLHPRTVWRIPENINVEPVEPPIRKILTDEIAVLNSRRAGNRGQAKGHKTTPVPA